MLVPLIGPFLVTIAGLRASAGAAENAPASASAQATMIERTASRESLPSLQCANIDISSHPEWRSVTLYDARSSALDAAQLDFCGNSSDQGTHPPWMRLLSHVPYSLRRENAGNNCDLRGSDGAEAGMAALGPPGRLASGVGQISAEVTGANARAQVIAQLVVAP